MVERSVCVAIATYKRPDILRDLLESVIASAEEAGCKAFEIVVVDNDPNESARALCGEWDRSILHYLAEPRPGIAAARNAGVYEALGADFVVFVDDDEVVEPQWLGELLRVQKATGADLVAGPVLSRLPHEPSKAVAQSGLFDRPSRPDEYPLTEAGSGNLLCRTSEFAKRSTEDWFQEAFSMTGGSDAELTRRFSREGARIVWASDAIAWEEVPSSRANLRWLAKRYRRVGSVDYRLEPDSSTKRVRGVSSGMARIASGALTLGWAWVIRGGSLDPAGFRRLFRGLGYVEAATFGGRSEYERRDTA